MAKAKTITDDEIQAYLLRASIHKGDTHLVAEGIRVIEWLVSENKKLRLQLEWHTAPDDQPRSGKEPGDVEG